MHGFAITEFEPPTPAGTRPDLLIKYRGEHLWIEVASPGPSDDALDPINARLHFGLERVASGLSVEVEGYEAHAGSEDPDLRSDRRVTLAQVDAVVNEFRRNAADLDHVALPQTVVAARPGQPVSIVAVESVPERGDSTFVCLTSGYSGLVPNVKRLVSSIRRERKQLPTDRPGAVLVDLTRWSDFRDADYYLEHARTSLARHRLPAFVGSFLWDNDRFAPTWRWPLHIDSQWSATTLGGKFQRVWGPAGAD